jgi:polar amino acid transport system permease protein
VQNSAIDIILNVHNFKRILEGLVVTMKIALSSMFLSVVLGVLLRLVMIIKNRII